MYIVGNLTLLVGDYESPVQSRNFISPDTIHNQEQKSEDDLQ